MTEAEKLAEFSRLIRYLDFNYTTQGSYAVAVEKTANAIDPRGGARAEEKHALAAKDVEKIEIDIFDVAYNIIGGSEEGDKKSVGNKEEADHSLPYIVSVALLDGQVMPEQYEEQRKSVVSAVENLEEIQVDELARRLDHII